MTVILPLRAHNAMSRTCLGVEIGAVELLAPAGRLPTPRTAAQPHGARDTSHQSVISPTGRWLEVKKLK